MRQCCPTASTQLAACARASTQVLFVLILFSMRCLPCWSSIRTSPPESLRRSHIWNPPPRLRQQFRKETCMSNEKDNPQRPQSTPEVVHESTPTPAPTTAAVAHPAENSYREPQATPVARPIVEVVAEVQTPAFAADAERATR